MSGTVVLWYVINAEKERLQQEKILLEEERARILEKLEINKKLMQILLKRGKLEFC